MVKCLTDSQKNFVIYHYHKKVMTQRELAQSLGVSDRTIKRVLIEFNLATPVERIQAEAKQVMALLKKYKLSIKELEKLLQDRQFIHAA